MGVEAWRDAQGQWSFQPASASASVHLPWGQHGSLAPESGTAVGPAGLPDGIAQLLLTVEGPWWGHGGCSMSCRYLNQADSNTRKGLPQGHS